MDSVEVVWPECVFVKGYIVKSKYWVGIVRCSEGQKLVWCFYLICI